MEHFNPFVYGRPLTPSEFLGREKIVRRLLSRVAQSQSTAIIGTPHIGKTSLLNYLLSEAGHLFSPRFDKYIFSFLDARMLTAAKSQTEFWALTLKSIETHAESGIYEGLVTLYRDARDNDFSLFSLERLFSGLHRQGSRLILLIDEFDYLLTTSLNKAEFFGGLRSLASRSEGFVVVLSSRLTLDQLNKTTEDVNRYGSPYFNIYTEIHLPALTIKEYNKVLSKAPELFSVTSPNEAFVHDISGRHPYLTQLSAAILWDAHQDGLRGFNLYTESSNSIYRYTKSHYSDTWRTWSERTRKIITILALIDLIRTNKKQVSSLQKLTNTLAEFNYELDILYSDGIVKQLEGEWLIAQKPLLWWFADELLRTVRYQYDFSVWLQEQQIENLFSMNEITTLGEAARQTRLILTKGTKSLIEAFAQTFTQEKM